MPYIELKNINKVFNPNSNREHHALKNISLVINKGDFITIIGGNGAGKSTLFNAISGVFPLDSGSISINDVEISSTKEFERAKYISRVFQNPLDNTAPRMTVAENMALALNRGERRTLKFSKNKDNIALFENLLKNLTALMITHNLQDALTYGNRMLLLHQGEIVRDFSEEAKKKLSVTDLYKIMVDLDE